MTPFSWSDLRALNCARRYPALLARMPKSGTTSQPMDFHRAFTDVLESPLPEDLPSEQRLQYLVEAGELAAARSLAELTGSPLPSQLVRVAARHGQEVHAALRHVLGRLLILKDTRDARKSALSAAVSRLEADRELREGRPGRFLELLRPLASELDAIVADALNRVRAEYRAIKEQEDLPGNGDFAIAIARLDSAVRSPETLSKAEKLLATARRLRDGGQLSPEDIRSLHAESSVVGHRLMRNRTEYVSHIAQAVDVLAFLDQKGDAFPWTSTFDRDKARELFKSLIPQHGSFNTEAVAKRLVGFLGLKTSGPLEKFALGSAVRIEIPGPRIPAFRKGNRTFPNGIHIVIPLRADESTIPALLDALPQGQLPVIYFPGRTEKTLRKHFLLQRDVPHLDNVDLLRLAECPIDQRPHAVQQLMLTRFSLTQLKPYQKGGPVSPEMFRGRREVVEKLKQQKGGTVLFSGRMMGKSSILHKIYDDIVSPANAGVSQKQYCVFVSSAADDLFTPLVNRLVELQPSAYRRYADLDRKLDPLAAVSPTDRRERQKKRLQNLRSLFNAVLANGHLTVLIDEADKFAAADAERSREESLAWLLRDLEHESPGRLRIVFAGFQTIHHQALFKNGAFANWFGLEQLGPLDSEDAEALVREPFADFGFLFASDAGVERILEFTGRHPLLTQEVCSRLMERVGSRRRSTTEDEFIIVESGDVEAVCRDDQIRDRVRQVLSLNLDDYPRLKLMVYLILFAASSAAPSLRLEAFRLKDLKELLIEFYGDRFNDYFDERSIGALVQELMALGLLSRQGDTYSFWNVTFADMLREDRQFERHLTELLSRVTSPERHGVRRFVTLADADLERLLRAESGEGVLVAGLPGTARTFIANRLFSGAASADAVLLDVAGCRSQKQLLGLLQAQLGDRRKGMSIADLAVKNGIATLALDDADALAQDGELPPLLPKLTERGVRLICFGGPELARCYVRSLLALGVDLLSLRRLSAADIRAWGEHGVWRDQAHQVVAQIVLDDQTSRLLEQTTGGHLSLVSKFAEHLRKTSPSKAEFIPDADDVSSFARALSVEMIRKALVDPLNGDERTVLTSLYQFAASEGLWTIEWEFVVQDILTPLSGGESGTRWLDAFEVLRLLDLVSEDVVGGQRRVLLTPDGPLARVFRS